MRKFILLSVISIISMTGFGQDFSTKGKDFWVAYGYHQVMLQGSPPNAQDMVLYFATDQVTTVTVTIPGIGYSQTFSNIAANTVFQTPPMPKNSPDARLFSEGTFDKGIHITSDKPIIAYAHIYNASVSGATILYPTPTLGKEYYSVNFTNNSNIGGANCWFYVIAADTGTTTVEITPSANTATMAAGNTYTVNLTQGQVFNAMGITSGNSGVDLTGSKIKSIASGTGGCKRIAVFSGSGRIAISCNGSTPSSDNYMVEGMPKSAWGKSYLTVPTANYNPSGFPPPQFMSNIYRVCVTDPTTVVSINGTPTALPLQGGFYYEIPASITLQKIEGDKPIMVAQYLPSQGGTGCPFATSGDGDPEVIYLSALEQSINTVRWDACKNSAIKPNKHYINVVIPNGGTALSSATLDGVPVPVSSFTPHPQNPNYSYALINVLGSNAVSIPHVFQSDSGFNAIAYGYGPTESYGYNAGTYIKDLYTTIGTSTQYGIEAGAVCQGTPLKFKISLPYQPDSIYWDLSGIINTPQYGIEKLLPILPATTLVPDSVTTVNGKPVYWYSLPSQYSFSSAGSYTIPITLFSSNADGCGNQQELDMPLEVTPPPGTAFTWITGGCPAIPVQFNDITVSEKPAYIWWWDFGDNTFGNTANPTHTYAAPGTYNVRFVNITTSGCISDTIVHQVVIPDLPNATISANVSACINAPSPSLTFTITGGVPPYQIDYSINGIAQAPIISATNTYTLSGIPTNVAGVFIYSLDSIKNQGSTVCKRIITGQTATVTISASATINLSSLPGTANQTVCVNTAISNIDFLIGGGGSGATFSPAVPGLSGSYNAATKTYTILGTPTAAGLYNLTVTPTGPCVDPSVFSTVVLNVSANATLSLAPGSSNTQTLCVNTLMPNIVYNVGGGATGANVVFTPPLPGVTGIYNGATSQFTISGTPTATAFPYTYSYAVSTVSSCQNPPPATGTITVNPDATIALSSAISTTNQTLCINNAIAEIDYSIGGSVTSVSVAPLPAGVTYLYTPGAGGAPGTLKITGTATAATAGALTYFVTLTGPCQVPAQMSGTINVNPNATISLAAGGAASQTVCINTLITQINYTIGGAVTSVNVTGLPAGVTYLYTPGTPSGTLTISGTPTGAGAFPYNITVVGPCQVPPATGGTITANPNATIALASAATTTNQTLCVNNTIAPINYTITGSVTSVSVAPLPAGITYLYTPGAGATPGTLQITGTATAATAGALTYFVTLTGPCQVPAQMSGTINVTANATISLAAGGPATQTVCINTSIAQINYIIGGAVTSVNVTGLPAGVTYLYTPGTPSGTLAILGTPTGAGAATYNITILGPCQVPPVTSGTITTTADATITIGSPGTNTQTVCINTPIVPIQYTLAGSATGATVTFTPPLPGVTGTVTGNTVNILGTPTAVSNVPVVYNYTVATQGPCIKPTATGSITVNPDHTLSSPGNNIQSVCLNTNIAPIIYTIGGGATGVTVTGLPAGLTFTVTGTQVTISGAPSATGTYTIQTTGNACIKAQNTGTITVIPLPTPNFNFTTPSCDTRVITFTDASVANAGTITGWAWNFGDGNNATGNPVSHLYAGTGTYTATLIVTTSNGCSNAVAFPRQVTINARPHADFTVPSSSCVNDVVQFTDASTGTLAANGYSWNFGDGSPWQNAVNGTHQYGTAGSTYTVTHVVTTTAGCTDTATHNIFISSAPVSDFSVTNAGTLCSNDSVAIVNLSTIAAGNISKLEVYWDYLNAPGTFDVDLAPTINKVYKHKYPTFQAPLSKPYTVRVVTYSGLSCASIKSTIVNVNATPKVQFNAMPDACYTAAPFQITQASEIGGVPGNGVYSGPGVSPTGLFSPLLAGIGTFTIKYTYTSAFGCFDTLSQTIKVLDTASAVFSHLVPLCEGNAATFIEQSAAPAGITLTNTTWTFGDGSPQETHSPGTTFNHSFPGAGSYTVTEYNTSSNSCKSTNKVQVVVVNPNPVPAFAFDQTTACLPNAGITFQNTSSITGGSAITYLWDFGDGKTSTARIPPAHIYTTTGPFTVVLAVKSDSGCVKTISHLVNFIHPQPIAAFDFNKPDVCIGGDVIVTDKTDGLDGTVVEWHWNFGDGITASTKQVQHLYTTAQTYNVELYIVNSQGCSSTLLSQPFMVNPYPVVDAGPDRVVLEGGSVTMQPVVTGFNLQYLWSPSTYLSSTTDATPTASIIMTDITYTLTVTGRGGCTAPSDNVTIKVLKAPKIPNTFTPNGDGINEKWLIDYLDTYPGCRVQVFTRTGQLVFESRGYKTPWDGKLNGKPLPFDTYYYIIEPGSGRPPITGYVTIIK